MNLSPKYLKLYSSIQQFSCKLLTISNKIKTEKKKTIQWFWTGN